LEDQICSDFKSKTASFLTHPFLRGTETSLRIFQNGKASSIFQMALREYLRYSLP
jgi:hypothetical protein